MLAIGTRVRIVASPVRKMVGQLGEVKAFDSPHFLVALESVQTPDGKPLKVAVFEDQVEAIR